LNYRFDRIFVADVGQNVLSVRSALQLPFTYLTFAVWKDEDRFLTIARTKRGESAGLWEINANTSEARKIEVRGLGFRDFLSLSPDGTAVVATATELNGALAWSIWRVDIGTGNVERLTHGREDVSPSWGTASVVRTAAE
jgi:Tol biopolymer transport system component